METSAPDTDAAEPPVSPSAPAPAPASTPSPPTSPGGPGLLIPSPPPVPSPNAIRTGSGSLNLGRAARAVRASAKTPSPAGLVLAAAESAQAETAVAAAAAASGAEAEASSADGAEATEPAAQPADAPDTAASGSAEPAEGQEEEATEAGASGCAEGAADGLREASAEADAAADAASAAALVAGTKKSLGGFFRGALSGLAGVVAQAASAAGLEGLAETLTEAAEQRAVNFEQGIDAAADGAAGRSLSQRFRSGVKRSLSMSRRMRFGDADDVDVVEGLHFSLTERQQQLRAEAEQFSAAAADPAAVREREAAGTFPREALTAAAGRGYGRLLVPRTQGGLGLGMDASCGVMEALGASDLPLAGLLAAHNAANYLLSTHGTSKILEKLVRQMGSLSSLAALAVSEAPGGSDLISTTTCVEKDASGQFYTLNGAKAWVAGGAAADVFIVLARSSVEPKKGLSLFALTKNMPGVSVGRPVALSGWRSCPVVPLSFSRVVVRTEYMVGREGQGMELLEEAYALLRTWLAAAAVSYGETLLNSAVDSVSGGLAAAVASLVPGLDGGPLERPANQAELVKTRTQLQAARLMVRAAAQQLDCKAPTAACEACTAKVYAVRAAQRAAETAERLLGWRAMQADQPCHAALRNLHAADFVGGPPDALYGAIFAEMYRISAA